MTIKQAVILAGGLGTRLKPFTDDNPKPMYPIHGKPFLQYIIEQLKDYGITEILLLLGYKAEKVIDYFGDGNRFGVHISYRITPVEYETGKRLKDAEKELQDNFLMLYSDNYCPVNLQKAEEQFFNKGYKIQFTGYTNKDGYTKSNLKYDGTLVTVYDKIRKSSGLNAVDIGYAFVNKSVFQYMPDDNVNFEAVVYPRVVEERKMGCFVTDHRYYSIGGWERMPLTEEFFRTKKVVFLDRDGTINERPPKADYVKNISEFHWLPGAGEAIKKLKDNGYDIYIVSNQPGIARGKMTQEDLDNIQRKMESDLVEIGAKIDGWYYCPHGWDEGCECRKPKPGLFYMAQKEHSLDLSKCVMIGDDERDIEAGKAAGIKRNYLISSTNTLIDVVDSLASEK